MSKRLKYALINASIAGALVFFGAFVNNFTPSIEGFIAAIAAGALIFLYKMQDYFNKKGRVFEFI